MEIVMIAAVAQNRVIGKDNQLLWHLPDDFKFFKQQTTGHFIVMGRKTFESFPKPLPNRTHLIISRKKNYTVPENYFVFDHIDKALAFCQEKKQDKIFVIGGGEIYRQLMPFATELLITEVQTTLDGDTFFPEIDEKIWRKKLITHHEKDDKHRFTFDIYSYQRI